jgi:hypothetical protein
MQSTQTKRNTAKFHRFSPSSTPLLPARSDRIKKVKFALSQGFLWLLAAGRCSAAVLLLGSFFPHPLFANLQNATGWRFLSFARGRGQKQPVRS